MDDFHFLRPGWLLAVPLAPLLGWLMLRRLTRLDPWLAACDAKLLTNLRERSVIQLSTLPFMVFGTLGALIALTLAGPTWDPAEAAVHRTMRARVVALDLSRSMDAADVSPSRIAVARNKAAEVFRRTTDDQVGLVVFAGEGFFIAPLSSDPASLIGILPAFTPAIISAQGSRPDLGLREAGWLVRRAGAAGGEIVLITDGASGRRGIGAARRLREDGIRVSVLAVGTEVGAPIPLRGGGYMRNLRGDQVIARTNLSVLREIAVAGGGEFSTATADSRDLDLLLAADLGDAPEGAAHDTGKSLLIWLDRGPWMAVALLPLALLGFRRGWLFGLCMALLQTFSLASPPVWAAGDIGPVSAAPQAAAGERVKSESANHSASEWRWQAIDHYRSGRYVEAAALFGEGRHPSDHYNRGNALAKAGFYQAAIAAYQQSIAADSDDGDARFNRALVESLLDEQQREERGEGQGGSRGRPAGDAETSGSGESGDGEGGSGEGQGAPQENSAPEQGDRNPQDGREGTDEQQAAPASLSAAELAETENQRVEATRPAPGGSSLSAAQMVRMEQALTDIAQDRLGLWQRKIEQQWRNNPRRDLSKSDAW